MRSVSKAVANIRRAITAVVAFAAITALSIPCARAQSNASLNGTVTDPTGAAVPDVKVTATNQATGVVATTQTDTAGTYLFSTLPSGTYRIEVSSPNFQTAVIAAQKLDVATTVTRNVQLTVGSVTQQVTITAEAPLIEMSTPGVGQVINDVTVQDIPLNGRHFVDLGLLTAGTVTPPANGFLTAPLRGQGSFAIDTAGQREDTTNWLVNGINLSDPQQNQITFQPPVDTLSEFKIDNSTFSAQYGRNMGAIVNIATRSGSNDFHGEAFEFFRNNALDARNYFNPIPLPQAAFKRNNFGADFGGPIAKNKLFFFLAYEGLRQRQGLTVSATVPSQNQIATVTSPAVRDLLKEIPAANLVGTGTPGVASTFNLFSGAALANVALNQGSADLDYIMSDTDQFHFYYVVQKDHRQEPTQGSSTAAANLPGFGDTRDGFRQLMTISEDHTFNSHLTNTVRIGFNRIHLLFSPTVLNPADFAIGLPAGSPVGVAIPNINVSGSFDFGGPTNEPQGRGDTTGALNDTLSWLKGRHSLAFGAEIRRAYNNNISENIGQFIFTPTIVNGVTTATSIQNFLADRASTFQVQEGAGNDRVVQPAWALFAQDSFKLRPNFTLNAGLRYEWNGAITDALGRFTNFDTTTGTLRITSNVYPGNKLNFEPRVGFAWDPFGDRKTSVRAAYAIMTQAPVTGIVAPSLTNNPPFALPINATSATSAITLENPSASITGLSLGPTAISPNFKNAYGQDWNLTIERQFTGSTSLQVAYVGSKGTHLVLLENINQPFVINGVYAATRPFPSLPLSSPVLPAQCAPPFPVCPLSNMNETASVGNSNYNALWLTLTQRLSHGFEFLTSYTYSKSLDYNSIGGANETIPLQNSYDPRGDYGPSEFDARHRFVFSGIYSLPFKGNRLVSGWQFGIISQAQTGNPLTPLVTIGPGSGISLNVRPNVTGPVQVTGSPAQWFQNKAVFVSPCTTTAGVTRCTPGNMGRDSVSGPGFLNTDFSVTKNTKLTERFNLQFRGEIFDIFNHANFGNPSLTVGSSTFGQILSTRFPVGDFGSSRQIQLALKLMF
jgi:hypothetical protein